MVHYIITPWRYQKELLDVRSKFYPSNKDSLEIVAKGRRHAVALVSVWMTRGQCPHMVESTALLTSAILNDLPGNSSYCIRAAYSAAFCRLVTLHFVSPLQLGSIERQESICWLQMLMLLIRSAYTHIQVKHAKLRAANMKNIYQVNQRMRA